MPEKLNWPPVVRARPVRDVDVGGHELNFDPATVRRVFELKAHGWPPVDIATVGTSENGAKGNGISSKGVRLILANRKYRAEIRAERAEKARKLNEKRRR